MSASPSPSPPPGCGLTRSLSGGREIGGVPWRTYVCRLVVIILVQGALTLLGGVAFHFIERPAEVAQRARLQQALTSFMGNHSCVSQPALTELIAILQESFEQHIFPVPPPHPSPARNWDFGSAVFFSGTVGATVGYGNIVPVTVGGKVFCACFIFLTVPITLAMCAMLGSLLTTLCCIVDKRMAESCACRCCECGRRLLRYVHPVLWAGLVLLILVPGLIIWAVEDSWTFAEVLYFIIMSISTVGLGDYVVGDDLSDPGRAVYLVASYAGIIVGLVWLTAVFQVHQDIYVRAINGVQKGTATIAADIKRSLESLDELEKTEKNGSNVKPDTMELEVR